MSFEQYTAWDRAGGVAERSGSGDLDVVIYSARKWCRLALAGNPTVLIALFAPDDETMVRTEPACELIANARRFVSRLAADRFLGYLRARRAAMIGESAAHANRLRGLKPLTPTLPAQNRGVHRSPSEFKNPVNVDLQRDHRTTAVVHEPQMSGSIATKSATKRSCTWLESSSAP